MKNDKRSVKAEHERKFKETLRKLELKSEFDVTIKFV
jgi:hypothetical protein